MKPVRLTYAPRLYKRRNYIADVTKAYGDTQGWLHKPSKHQSRKQTKRR